MKEFSKINHTLESFRQHAGNIFNSKPNSENKNNTNVYEENKLIVFMRNLDYFGLWVKASDLDKQREVFAKQSHLIVNSPIEAGFFLKIKVSDINILNEYPNE